MPTTRDAQGNNSGREELAMPKVTSPDIHLKRLTWMAQAEFGQLFPAYLFGDNAKPGDEGTPADNWGKAVAETAQWALDEIAKSRKIP